MYLEKNCPQHGFFRTIIWRGQPDFAGWVRPKIPTSPQNPFTQVQQGCPFDCGLCPDHRQQPCCVLLEVTQRCDLRSAFCFANAGGKQAADPSLEAIEAWYRRLLAAGGPFNIQLSVGLGGGVECQSRRGYHMREADLYVEIIDPDTGRPVVEGEFGEVVFTTLTRRGMPLIRYRTSDLSRFIPDNCPCGTVLKTLARIKNRLSGYVKIGDSGFLTMAELDEALFPLAGLLNFSAAVTNKASKDCLCLDVKVTKNAASGLAPTVY